MSNALHTKSYKNAKDIDQKCKILTARYVKDFQKVFNRDPLQHEKDQLENLATLKITFDDIRDRIKKGRDHKREYLAILARYDKMVKVLFNSKAGDVVKEGVEGKTDFWDEV